MVSAEKSGQLSVQCSDVPMATDVRNMGLGAAGIAELVKNPIQEGENSTPNNFHNRNRNFKSSEWRTPSSKLFRNNQKFIIKNSVERNNPKVIVMRISHQNLWSKACVVSALTVMLESRSFCHFTSESNVQWLKTASLSNYIMSILALLVKTECIFTHIILLNRKLTAEKTMQELGVSTFHIIRCLSLNTVNTVQNFRQ